ncbi:MAG: hypothetical protein ACM31C_32350 [Acidobacteriota bacterium]
MRLGVVVLALLGGCNQVFGLESTQLRDGGDGADSNLDAPPAGCHFVELDADIAAYIVDAGMYGKDSELFTDATHHTLVAFPMDGVGAAGEHIAGVVLKLAPITKCTDQCTPCLAAGAMPATRFQAYWSWDIWNEGNVDETERDSGNPWNAAGADAEGAMPGSGLADRSPRLVDAPMPPVDGTVYEFRVPRSAIESNRAEPWFGDHSGSTPVKRLTIQLRTDRLAAFASDDHDGSPCNEPEPLPRLTVTTCP